MDEDEDEEEGRVIAEAMAWFCERKPNHPVHHGLLLEQSLQMRLSLAAKSRGIGA